MVATCCSPVKGKSHIGEEKRRNMTGADTLPSSPSPSLFRLCPPPLPQRMAEALRIRTFLREKEHSIRPGRIAVTTAVKQRRSEAQVRRHDPGPCASTSLTQTSAPRPALVPYARKNRPRSSTSSGSPSPRQLFLKEGVTGPVRGCLPKEQKKRGRCLSDIFPSFLILRITASDATPREYGRWHG